MTTSTKCLLACIDGSELSNVVIEHAIWLANNSQSPIKFLHTIEHSHRSEQVHREGTITPNMKEHLLDELSDEERSESKQLIAEGKIILNHAKQMAEQAGLTKIIAKQRHGSLPETLADLEDEIAIVVLGSKGEDHDGNKKGLGSQLEGAIRAIHSPVFIVKSTDFSEPKKLMFAYNGSPTSKIALEFIKKGTFCTQSLEVHLVCVQKNMADSEQLVEEAKVVLTEGNINFVATALAGEAMDELLRYQQQNDIDTTAMGAFSHGKVHGLFFGSFTTQMLLESSSNFLLIR
ncbi:MAG: universal stress protein [Methylophagaceae bacterium]